MSLPRGKTSPIVQCKRNKYIVKVKYKKKKRTNKWINKRRKIKINWKCELLIGIKYIYRFKIIKTAAKKRSRRPDVFTSQCPSAARPCYYCSTAPHTTASWLVHSGTCAVRALQCQLIRWAMANFLLFINTSTWNNII